MGSRERLLCIENCMHVCDHVSHIYNPNKHFTDILYVQSCFRLKTYFKVKVLYSFYTKTVILKSHDN